MTASARPPPTDGSSGPFGLPAAILLPSASGFAAAFDEARDSRAAACQASVCRWQVEATVGHPFEPGCFWLAVDRFAKAVGDLAALWHVASLALPPQPHAAATEMDAIYALLGRTDDQGERAVARRLVAALERRSAPVRL